MHPTDQTATGDRQVGPPEDAGFHSGIADAARREMEDLRDRVADTADQLRSEGAKAGSTAARLVLDELDRRKDTLSTGLKAVQTAVRDAARAGDAPTGVMTQAAHLLDDACAALDRHSVREVGTLLSGVSQRNPAAFVAGCVLTGLALGRFLTAAPPSAPASSTAPVSSPAPDPHRSPPGAQGAMAPAAGATPSARQCGVSEHFGGGVTTPGGLHGTP